MSSNMNTKMHLFNDVVKERKLGVSLGDLSKKYNLSKSTVSLWCRNIRLSNRSKLLISENWFRKTTLAREKGSRTIRQKRLDNIQKEYSEARKMVGELSKRDLFILGSSLYWAEGSKKETGSGFSFINSDPLMIKMMIFWLTNIMNISKDELIINLSINIAHKDREDKILKFWSNLLDFPVEDFNNSIFIKVPLRRVYDNHSNYYGMIRVKVKSSSGLRRRILGIIKIFGENADVAQVARASHS